MKRLFEYGDILYANFDGYVDETFNSLKSYIITHNTHNKILYAINLQEGEIVKFEWAWDITGVEANRSLSHTTDELFSKLNTLAVYFKECHFYNMNPLLQKSFDIIDEVDKNSITAVHSYPYSILNRTKFYKYVEHMNSDYVEKKFDKHFIFMNAVAKPHRIRLYIDFHKYNILDTAYISWLNKNNILGQDLIKEVKSVFGIDLSKQRILDSADLINTEQDNLPDCYSSAAIDVFGESIDNNKYTIIVSEKTWKPILYKKVFLGFSCSGFYNWLKNDGFILYDELIDYSFDDVDDYNKRYELFWNEIYKLSQIPLDELTKKIDSIRWKLEHNYNIAMSKNSIPSELTPYVDMCNTDLLWINNYE